MGTRGRKASPMIHVFQVWITGWYQSLKKRMEEEQEVRSKKKKIHSILDTLTVRPLRLSK